MQLESNNFNKLVHTQAFESDPLKVWELYSFTSGPSILEKEI